MIVQSRYLPMRLPPVTITILAIQIIAWCFSRLLIPIAVGCNSCIAAGEWWRFLTPVFLHTDFSHLLSNCLSLSLLGAYLEPRLGKLQFCSLFLFTGICGNIATYFLMPPSFIHVGASGAIFGLLGIHLYLFYLQKHRYEKQHLTIFILLLLFLVSMTFLESSVNIAAHLGGLLSGGILSPFFIKE